MVTTKYLLNRRHDTKEKLLPISNGLTLNKYILNNVATISNEMAALNPSYKLDTKWNS